MAPADQAGAVVRRRTIFFGLGGGGAAAVLPSSSAAAAFGSGAAAGSSAGAALEVAACLLLPLVFAAWFDFGSSDGGAAAAAAAAAFCWSICSWAEPLYKFFGTPCSRPGTPSGNTGLRSPGSFFLVSSQSSRSLGSKLLMPPAQPANAPDSAIRTAAAIRRCEQRMVDFSLNSVYLPSAFRDRRKQPLQRLGTRAQAWRRLAVVGNQIQPLPRGRRIVGAPGRQRQQFARGMTKRRPRRGSRLQALQHTGIARGFQQQSGRADPGKIPLRRTDAAIGSDVVIQFRRSLRIAVGDFRGGAQPRQHAISRRRLCSQVGKGRFGLGMLVLFGELDGLVERSPGFGRLLRFEVLVATPTAHRGDDQQRAGNDIDRILVPQLFEPLATYLFVYFIK